MVNLVRSSISQQIRVCVEISRESLVRQILPATRFIGTICGKKTASAAKDAIAEQADLQTVKSAEEGFLGMLWFVWISRFLVDNGCDDEMLRHRSRGQSRINFPMF